MNPPAGMPISIPFMPFIPQHDAVLAVLFVVLYFAPTIVAVLNRSRSAGSIFLLNLVLGLTGIGWIAALIWSYLSPSFGISAEVLPVAGVAAAGKPVTPSGSGWLKKTLIGVSILLSLLVAYAFYGAMTIERKPVGTTPPKPAISVPKVKEGVPLPAEELFGK